MVYLTSFRFGCCAHVGSFDSWFCVFLCYSFIASLRPWSLATSGLPAMALCPKRAGFWPAAGLCDLKKKKKNWLLLVNR